MYNKTSSEQGSKLPIRAVFVALAGLALVAPLALRQPDAAALASGAAPEAAPAEDLVQTPVAAQAAETGSPAADAVDDGADPTALLAASDAAALADGEGATGLVDAAIPAAEQADDAPAQAETALEAAVQDQPQEAAAQQAEPAAEEPAAEPQAQGAPAESQAQGESTETVQAAPAEVSAEMSAETVQAAPAEAPAVGFVYLDLAQVEVGATQSVAVVFDDADLAISDATLHWVSESTGTDHATAASAIASGAVLFQFAPETADSFRIVSMDLTVGGASFSVDLVGDGSACTFSAVYAGASTASAFSARTTSTDTGGTSYAATDGGAVGEGSLESSLATATSAVFTLGADGILTVCLDPGHGGSDPGSSGFGIDEKDVNLAIALYCKAKLEQNPRVHVVLTRTGDYSLVEGNVKSDLWERAYVARDNNADVYVSIHNNWASVETANGCEVYYPNPTSTWKWAETVRQGQGLAQEIIDRLTSLGLTNRGAIVHNPPYDEDESYPDQSEGDYYALIRHPREFGIPSVVVEHAFVSNASDAAKLSDPAWQKLMGEADADAILACWSEALSQAGGEERLIDGNWYYVCPDGSYATGFTGLADGRTVYYDTEGRMVLGQERYIDGAWYYFDGWDGHMHTGLTDLGYKWVYYDADGKMVLGEERHIDGDWYYFDGWDGHMATGLTWIGYKTVYYNSSGQMLFGLQTIGGRLYYLDSWDGHLTMGEKNLDGKWYYFDPDQGGAAATGWVDLTYVSSSKRVYYLADGTMAMGTVTIDGQTRRFDTWDGHLIA